MGGNGRQVLPQSVNDGVIVGFDGCEPGARVVATGECNREATGKPQGNN
jgi:Na+-translocating ferredoxin:NAD+ oxidoreductase RNF subunit RnfB